MLEGVFKGFIQWLFSLILEMVSYLSDSLLEIFSLDFEYLAEKAPVLNELSTIIMGVGIALLLGNTVFQCIKIISGLGDDDTESPSMLFLRTFISIFLVVVSSELCSMVLKMTAAIITLLQVPDAISIPAPDDNAFSIGASWLLAIIVGLVIVWQVIRLFFEVGERYFVLFLLSFLSPWALAMGGSKKTKDISVGWCRMFGSMCIIMLLNIILLKIVISILASMPSDPSIIPWTILVVAVVRTARKIDNYMTQMGGLRPAITGDGFGRSMPGMLAYGMMRMAAGKVARTVAANSGSAAAGARSGGSFGSSPHAGAGTSNTRPSSSQRNSGSSGGAARNTGRPNCEGNSGNNTGFSNGYSTQSTDDSTVGKQSSPNPSRPPIRGASVQSSDPGHTSAGRNSEGPSRYSRANTKPSTTGSSSAIKNTDSTNNSSETARTAVRRNLKHVSSTAGLHASRGPGNGTRLTSAETSRQMRRTSTAGQGSVPNGHPAYSGQDGVQSRRTSAANTRNTTPRQTTAKSAGNTHQHRTATGSPSPAQASRPAPSGHSTAQSRPTSTAASGKAAIHQTSADSQNPIQRGRTSSQSQSTIHNKSSYTSWSGNTQARKVSNSKSSQTTPFQNQRLVKERKSGTPSYTPQQRRKSGRNSDGGNRK